MIRSDSHFPSARLLSAGSSRRLVFWLASCLVAATAPAAPARQSREALAATAQQGKEAMAAGRFDEAAALYAEIVEALPEEPLIRFNLGMALCMAGRPGEALPQLERALEQQPKLVPAHLFLGMAHVELGHPDRAREPLERFLAAQPDHLEARRMLADALLSLEDFGAAAQHFRELSRRAPEDPGVWYGLGLSYEGVAQQVFEELQVSAPESHQMLLLVADLMAASGRDARALQLYREALAMRPGIAHAHDAVAGIYERTGHPDWAAAEREKLKALPPPECPGFECGFRQGRHDAVFDVALSDESTEGRYWLSRAADAGAREAFAQVTRLPPSPEASLLAARVLRSRKDFQAAIDELKKAAETWPEDLQVKRALVDLLFLAEDAAAARPIVEELVAHEPESAELALMLGETWARGLEPEKAIPHLETAVERDPTLLQAQAALGRAYLEAGRAERAVAPLEAALETDTDGSLHFDLARAYRASGQAERAREALRKFRELRDAAEARRAAPEDAREITPPR